MRLRVHKLRDHGTTGPRSTKSRGRKRKHRGETVATENEGDDKRRRSLGSIAPVAVEETNADGVSEEIRGLRAIVDSSADKKWEAPRMVSHMIEKSKSVRKMTEAEQVEELRRTETENAALKLRLQKKRELLSELKTDTDEH